MESASTSLRSIMEEEEEEEEIEPSTVGSGKMPWKQDLRSIQEMEDKENFSKYPDHISDLSASEKKVSQSIRRSKQKGFNLRKSLAWNPAFFSEEGVLDPAELSFICGSTGESNKSRKSSNRHVLNDAVKNSYSKSQMKSESGSHNGRKLFTTPEPPRRQEKKASEGIRKLKQSKPSTKTLLRPPTTSHPKRVANTSATGNVPKLQRFIQGNTALTSRVSNDQEIVARAGENSNDPRRIQSIQEKKPVFPPKSSTGAENSAASQMSSQTIPKAPTDAPLTIRPSALRKPSPSFGFFAQGNVAAQSGCSSQKSTGKPLTGIPSSLPKAPPSKWRLPIGCDAATKLTAATSSQSKIPQRMRFDRPMVSTTGKKRIEKSTRTPAEPREKAVASQLARNHFSPGTCSTKDLDTAIGKSKDTCLATVSAEAKEPAVTQMTCNFVSSKVCNPMDAHVTLIKLGNPLPKDDSSKQNQYKNSSRAFVEAEEPHAVQQTSNSIVTEACSSINESAVVSKSDAVGSNVNTDGVKHMEEDNRICGGGEETVATLLTQNSILSETCSLMDVDVIISKSNDIDSKVNTNNKKHTLYSNKVCDGQKEETVVVPSTCTHMPPETCSSKDKHTTRNDPNVNGPARSDIAKVSVSPLGTQRGKTDFSPCKEKPLEKRFKLDSGSSIGEKESFEHEKPEAGKVEHEIADELREGRVIPKFCKDLVPFSEEWLAALEVYGEEILVKKTGAVQNSPPDKTMPEPSPWSPVKRKAQDIGPYDCTKYNKTVPSSDAQ